MKRIFVLLKACLFGGVVSGLLAALWMLGGTILGTAKVPAEPLAYLKAWFMFSAVGGGLGLMGTLVFGFPILFVLAALGVRGRLSFVFWGVVFGTFVGLMYGSLLHSTGFAAYCAFIGAVTGWMVGRDLPIQSAVPD